MSYEPTGPQLRYLKSLGYLLEPPRTKDEASALLDVLSAGGPPEKALAAMHNLRERELRQNVRFVLEEIRQIEDIIDVMPCAGFWLAADFDVDPRYQPFVNTFLPLHVAKRFPNLLATLDYEELERSPARARTVTECGEIVEMTFGTPKPRASISLGSCAFAFFAVALCCVGVPLAVVSWMSGSGRDEGHRVVEPVKASTPSARVVDSPIAKNSQEASPDRPEASIALTAGPDEQSALKLRTWTSADGKFTTAAEFVSMTAGVVTLRKTDGSTVKVPVE